MREKYNVYFKDITFQVNVTEGVNYNSIFTLIIANIKVVMELLMLGTNVWICIDNDDKYMSICIAQLLYILCRV